MPKVMDKFVDECLYNLMRTRHRDVIVAYKYVSEERNLENDVIQEFKIGYCRERQNIPIELSNYGGEFFKGDYVRDLSKFIAGKIIVPIYEESGERIVGLATRSPISGKDYTWWNLPYPFQKSMHLYMLSHSKKYLFQYNKVYVVEGYMDALSLWQNGIRNVVCLMGTAFTLRHIGLILRYCNNICFCFDMDENGSGQKAFSKSISMINKLNVFEKISHIKGLPIGEDPDNFIKNNGKEMFLSLEHVLSKEEISEIIYHDSKKNKR